MKLLKPLTPWWEEIDGARFRLRPLAKAELMQVYGDLELRAGYWVGRGIAEAARFALIDWDGVLDHQGAPAQFGPGAFERLPLRVVTALGKAALEGSEVEAEAEKNSASPSRSGAPTPPWTAPDAAGEGTATSGTPLQ